MSSSIEVTKALAPALASISTTALSDTKALSSALTAVSPVALSSTKGLMAAVLATSQVYTFTLRVTDANGCIGTKSCSVTIAN